MPGATEESLVDLVVSGDVIPEGFTFVTALKIFKQLNLFYSMMLIYRHQLKIY
jgi:hypothetical protein